MLKIKLWEAIRAYRYRLRDRVVRTTEREETETLSAENEQPTRPRTMEKLATVDCDLYKLSLHDVSMMRLGIWDTNVDYFLPNSLGRLLGDADIAALEVSPRLKAVGLENAEISDVAIKDVAAFPSLLNLDIDSTGVTDDGIRSLAGHRTLEVLWIEETAITDAGLSALLTCPRLAYISAIDTGVSRALASEFAKHGVEIWYSPSEG